MKNLWILQLLKKKMDSKDIFEIYIIMGCRKKFPEQKSRRKALLTQFFQNIMGFACERI